MGFQRHELSAKFSDNKGSDPVGLVLGKNLHRRHLTPIQRAELVVGCRKWAAGGRPKTVQPVSKPATNEDMARQVQAEITKEIAQARAEGDRDAEDKTRDKLRAWNEKNPDSPIRIDAKAIATQARQIKQDRAARLEKSAPKSMRPAVRGGVSQCGVIVDGRSSGETESSSSALRSLRSLRADSCINAISAIPQ